MNWRKIPKYKTSHYWKRTVHLHTYMKWSWKLTEMTISNLRPPLLEIFGTKVSNFSNKENANMTKANISKAKGDLWKKEKFFRRSATQYRSRLFNVEAFLEKWFFSSFGYIVHSLSTRSAVLPTSLFSGQTFLRNFQFVKDGQKKLRRN